MKMKAEEELYFIIDMIFLIVITLIVLIITIAFFYINYGLTSKNPVSNYILNKNVF